MKVRVGSGTAVVDSLGLRHWSVLTTAESGPGALLSYVGRCLFVLLSSFERELASFQPQRLTEVLLLGLEETCPAVAPHVRV